MGPVAGLDLNSDGNLDMQTLQHIPLWVFALISWVLTGLLVSWAFRQNPAPAGASYNLTTQRFTLPRSWWPLALFMAIIAGKFVVGMLSAVAPEHFRSLPAASGHRHQRLVWAVVRHRDRSGLAFFETSMKENV